jgi:hypothetical protein
MEANPLLGALGQGTGQHAGVAVQDEMDVGEILEPQELLEVADVRVDADVRGEPGPAITPSGKGRTVDIVSTLAQAAMDVAPAPASVHGAVHQDECGHVVSSPHGRARQIPILPAPCVRSAFRPGPCPG